MRLRVRLGVLFVAFISFLFINYFYLFIFCLQKNLKSPNWSPARILALMLVYLHFLSQNIYYYGYVLLSAIIGFFILFFNFFFRIPNFPVACVWPFQ